MVGLRARVQGFWRRRSRGVRYLVAAMGACAALVAAALATSPVWLTPLLQADRPALEAALTRAAGAQVRVGALAARAGWRPGIVLRDVVVMGRAGPAVAAGAVRVDLSWLALARGRLWPAFIGINGMHLSLRETAHGVHIVGLARHAGPVFDWRRFLGMISALRLEAGQITVALPGPHTVSLEALDASWATGIKDHTLTASASIPGVCGRCQVTVEFAGRRISRAHFDGAVGIHAAALDLQAAAALTGRRGLRPLAGTVNGRLWSDWDQGRLGFVGGKVALARVFVPANSVSRAMAIGGLAGRFSLKMTPQGFRLYAADVVSSLAGVDSRTKSLYVARRGRQWSVDATRLHLTQVVYLASHLHLHPRNRPIAAWLGLGPRGTLTRLDLRAGRRHYEVRAHFTGLGLGHPGSGPFFAHASGTVVASTHSGALTLSGIHGLVRGPAALPGPLHVQALAAHVSWHTDAQGLSWRLSALHLLSSAGTIDAVASGSRTIRQGPVLFLKAVLHDVHLSALKNLYPRTLHRPLRQWLTRTIRAGLVTRGHVTLEGPLADFPFRDGNGVFHVRLHIRRGRYRFLPDWPSARHLMVTASETGAALSVRGSGVLGGLPVPKVSVHAGPLGTPSGTVTVRVHAQGGLGKVLTVVLPHVRRPLQAVLPTTISGAGAAQLSLVLDIPFSRRQGPLALHGQVSLAHATLRYPLGPRALRWRALTGKVAFNGAGPERARLSGRLLGGPFALTLAPLPHGGVGGGATGMIDAAHLAALAGPARRYVHGPVNWRLHVIRRRRLVARVRADLRALALDLPYPAGKAAGVPATLRLTMVSDARGVFAHGVVARHLGLAYARARGGRQGLWVGVGSALPPKVVSPGLAVGVRSGYLAIAPWITFVQGLSRTYPAAQVPSLATPRALAGYVGSLVWAGRSFGVVHARFERQAATWAGVLEGPDVAGSVTWRERPHPALALHLTRLVIPASSRAPHAPKSTPSVRDPRRLPAVRFTANSLTVDGDALGHVVIDGAPNADGFRFRRITVVQPPARLSGSGQWTRRGGQSESQFTLAFASTDLGRSLSAWGLPHQVAGGRTTASGTISWPGGPEAFALRHLTGHMRFASHDGRFIRVKEGAGKLLGIFNVDSLTRYLTLDFDGIFGRGFAFNSIDGTLTAFNGHAKTPGIHIAGPSADMIVAGEADLAARTFNLRIRVQPRIQNNVTLATGLLGGPIAGAAVLLMQKIFAHEIDQGTQTTYYVEGPWSKPSIHRKPDKE